MFDLRLRASLQPTDFVVRDETISVLKKYYVPFEATMRVRIATAAGTPVRDRPVTLELRDYDAALFGGGSLSATAVDGAALSINTAGLPSVTLPTNANGEVEVTFVIDIGAGGVVQPPSAALQQLEVAVKPAMQVNERDVTYGGCDGSGVACEQTRVLAHNGELVTDLTDQSQVAVSGVVPFLGECGFVDLFQNVRR